MIDVESAVVCARVHAVMSFFGIWNDNFMCDCHKRQVDRHNRKIESEAFSLGALMDQDQLEDRRPRVVRRWQKMGQ